MCGANYGNSLASQEPRLKWPFLYDLKSAFFIVNLSDFYIKLGMDFIETWQRATDMSVVQGV